MTKGKVINKWYGWNKNVMKGIIEECLVPDNVLDGSGILKYEKRFRVSVVVCKRETRDNSLGGESLDEAKMSIVKWWSSDPDIDENGWEWTKVV